jgi:hypothetical protein
MNDLCDRCSAQAKSMAIMPSGMVLSFCQHHINAHAAALLASGALLDVAAGALRQESMK